MGKLDQLAAEHPEAFAGHDVASWTTIFEGPGGAEGNEPMANKTFQTGVRLPVTLLERLDALTAKWMADNPGVSLSRSDAVRMLLVRALNAEEGRES